MTRLIRRTFGVITLVAAALLIFWLTGSHQSEVLLSPGVGLTPEWQNITSPHMLLTEELRNEVLIEMPALHFPVDGHQPLLGDGTSLTIDAYLITEAANEIKLDGVSPEGFGGKVVLRLSTDALEWKRHDYRFRALALRSNRPVQTGKVFWISYDPRETKDGIAWPRAFK